MGQAAPTLRKASWNICLPHEWCSGARGRCEKRVGAEDMGQPLPLGPAVSFLYPPWYWMLGEDKLRACLSQP